MTNQILEAIRKGEIFHAHRTFARRRYFFETEDLEFGFIYFLGHAAHGACTLGEMLFLADQYRDGDPASWITAAVEMADRVETRARHSLQGGHTVSAREGLLRASFYHRIATAMISPRKEVEKWQKQFEISRTLFQEAAGLCDPPIEFVEIPFEDAKLPGYFQPASGGKPHKTLLIIGGGETFTEDLYFYIAPAAHARGYNFMTVDLPGQGGLPLEGLTFCHDLEIPMKVVIDYLLSRPEVDPERLATYGISAGGYIIPRAAAYDKRIKACIANSLLYDLERIFKSSFLQFGELFKKHDPLTYRLMDMIAWRWGVNSPWELIAKNRNCKIDPSLITCPTLIVIGEGEYQGSKEVQRQQHDGLEAIQNPHKRLVITPLDEGAGHHVLGENLPLMSQVVFDWLDSIFDKSLQ
ncbi:MAG: alpha/beta hydrolase [Anaerolineales bacterium]|jgi:alpha-beta hydrolase superfamily lysophospholipase